jgi:hypothetical protein
MKFKLTKNLNIWGSSSQEQVLFTAQENMLCREQPELCMLSSEK